jgi:hypothetical protein
VKRVACFACWAEIIGKRREGMGRAGMGCDGMGWDEISHIEGSTIALLRLR